MKTLNLTETELKDMIQFTQIARKLMEERFTPCGLQLLELDMGICGTSKKLIELPGAKRYFFKGTVVKCNSSRFHEFRTEFAMNLGDTREDDLIPLVDDVVVSVTQRFYQ